MIIIFRLKIQKPDMVNIFFTDFFFLSLITIAISYLRFHFLKSGL